MTNVIYIETIERFTSAQDINMYDIFTEVAAFMDWINATSSNMGGLQTCKNHSKENVRYCSFQRNLLCFLELIPEMKLWQPGMTYFL